MITIAQIREMFPMMDEDDAQDVAMSSTRDAHEGAEWLPHYKAALCRLVQATASLKAVVDRLTLDEPLKLNAKVRDVIVEAAEAYRDHLVLCGVGPNPTYERVAASTIEADEAKARFLRNTFSGTLN